MIFKGKLMDQLAPYACQSADSRGRQYGENRVDFRSPFQRDRDRIIHSTSFRRLMHKTQVFVVHESDLYRTRLTHTLEVAQVARTLARRLNLNEDLAEVVALSHDLGHPPFGHTGEDVLHEKMAQFGGFDHNAQALRIVSHLERRYIDFRGLNLTWESLEGIAKHNGPILGEIPWAMRDLCANFDLELHQFASAEAQIAAIADDIAYNHHDLQDGLRSKLLSDAQVREVPIINSAYESVLKTHPKAEGELLRYEALSRFFGSLVKDVYQQSAQNIKSLAPNLAADIRANSQAVIAFSPEMLLEINVLRKFLFKYLYRHENVIAMRDTAQSMVARAFDHAFQNPKSLPQDWQDGADMDDAITRAQLVCDYISGMTDRYLSKNWAFSHEKSWDR